MDNEEQNIIGPILPPHLSNKRLSPILNIQESEVTQNSATELSNPTIGPSLPPHLLERRKSETFEASSPSNNEEPSSSTDVSDTYGPVLPPHLKKGASTYEENEDSDEDVYGPLPAGVSSSSQAQQALEERALLIKLGQFDNKNDKQKSREEWMTELPEVRAVSSLGLGPRQFRKNEMADFSDRSSWTDTPEQKAKKSLGKSETPVNLKKEAELREVAKRDAEQGEMAKKHNKKRNKDKSLLEMHQDEIKKKKKEEAEAGIPTRRPFNRDIDLKANQFDEAQKKSMMKKAMHLDDRFSRGQSKYL